MSGDKTSGIARAIAVAGNQAGLSRLIWEKCRIHIWQSRISEWERTGWVSTEEKAQLVSQATGIPVDELKRKDKPPHRRVTRKRKEPA